jgi:hypothetical protein
LRAIEGLLAHLSGGGTLDGAESPRLIRQSCHQALQQAGDSRAAEVLAAAHAELQALADAITDATLRHSFLNNIPEHRAIMAAWAANGASPQDRK